MGSFLIGARIVLAGVFATAGMAKLVDLSGSRRSLAAFGIPQQVVPVAAVLLPLAELVTAAALVPTPLARWAALAALVLLFAFIGGIANALSRGQAPDCHCFGQLHSAPAGRATLARNATLAVVAAIVAWRGPGPSIDSWIAARTGAELAAVAAAATAVGLGAIALRLWTHNRGLRRDLEDARLELAALPSGLPVGAHAPTFTLADTHGTPRTLESLLARGRPVVLVFVAPDCGTCGQLLPELGRWQAMLADRLTVAVISRGTPQDNRTVTEEYAVNDVLLQEDSEVLKAYRVGVTPTAVVVSPERRIASALAEGPIAIEPLIRLTLRRGTSAPAATDAPARRPA